MNTLCIISRINSPTPEHLHQARSAALHAYHLVAKNWRIVTGDGHGIEAEVMKTCLTWEIPLLVCGTSVRPKNGVQMKHYQRIIVTGPQTEKVRAREQFMLGIADQVIYFHPALYPEAIHLKGATHVLTHER